MDYNIEEITLPKNIEINFCLENILQSEDSILLKLVEESSLIIGMHPDEITYDILKLATLFNKSFAIIPCCVFPNKFKDRKLVNQQKVVSYDDLIAYLLEYNSNIIKDTLNMEGKNIVLKLEI